MRRSAKRAIDALSALKFRFTISSLAPSDFRTQHSKLLVTVELADKMSGVRGADDLRNKMHNKLTQAAELFLAWSDKIGAESHVWMRDGRLLSVNTAKNRYADKIELTPGTAVCFTRSVGPVRRFLHPPVTQAEVGNVAILLSADAANVHALVAGKFMTMLKRDFITACYPVSVSQ